MLQISNATECTDQLEDVEMATTMLRPHKEVPWMVKTMVLKVSPSLPTTVFPSNSILHSFCHNEDNHVVITANIPVNKLACVEESMLDGEV